MNELSPDRAILPFRLPDVVRHSWSSLMAEEVWSFRFKRAAFAFRRAEIQSVRELLRPCALVYVRTSEVAALMQRVAKGLEVTPLAGTDDGQIRVVVSRSSACAQRFAEAWYGNDHSVVGRMLGYPECCIGRFVELWCNREQIDTIWEMAVATNGASLEGRTIDLQQNRITNPMLRLLGPRYCPHLPCSFTCPDSIASGSQFRELLRLLGFVDEVGSIDEALSWPCEWSGLHGIAEVRFPVGRLVMRTDPTAEEFKVRLASDVLPDLASRGLTFPNNQVASRRAHRDRLVELRRIDDEQPSIHELNGFATARTMEINHFAVERAVRAAIGGRRNAKLLDVGCGEGALLRRLARGYDQVATVGVERQPRLVQLARQRGGANQRFLVGEAHELQSWLEPSDMFDVGIVMIGRLLELQDSGLLDVLVNHTLSLVLYAYPGWSRSGMQLEEALETVGLVPIAVHSGIAALVNSAAVRTSGAA